MTVIWRPVTEERYCVDSGRPVQLIPGDRCLSHGNRSDMCTTAIRDPRCQHPRLSPNHPYPKCPECGNTGQQWHCPDHPGPLDDARNHICRMRPITERPMP